MSYQMREPIACAKLSVTSESNGAKIREQADLQANTGEVRLKVPRLGCVLFDAQAIERNRVLITSAETPKNPIAGNDFALLKLVASPEGLNLWYPLWCSRTEFPRNNKPDDITCG
jgi:hypothetical protein